MYADDNRDYVPEEGNTIVQIDDPQNVDAWYNIVVTYTGGQPLTNAYLAVPRNPPLPGSKSIFSCPSTQEPNTNYKKPPYTDRAFFMYGENGRLCVNKSTRASGASQTKLSGIKKVVDTIFLAETDPNSTPPPGIAQSNVTGQYGVARHAGNKRGNFSMCDGSSRAAGTNEFIRTSTDSNNSGGEWGTPRQMYWYPASDTPN